MVKHLLPAFLILALSLSLACADQNQPAPAKADPASVAKSIAHLGSDRYEERETAYQALDALGQSALDGLRKAAASRDEETRRRAIDLVQRIEKRLECARLNQPKLVHLVFKDTPVPQAVQELARKTGYQIAIEGDQTKLANRKITLDTGEIPFWQAVDQFCAKAGLVERGSEPLADTPVNPGYGVNGVLFLSDMSYPAARPETPLVFLDGKPQPLPTHYAGAMRVRVLPRVHPNAPGAPDGAPLNKSNDELPLTLQISSESKLGLQTILHVRLDKVLDDNGIELKTPLPYFSEPFGFDGQMWAGGFGGTMVANGSGQDFSKRVPIRLHVPDGVKKLKEIRGAVSAEVLTPHEPIITVEDILKSADKTVAGPDGSSIKVVEVKRDDKGQVTLRVMVEKPPTPQTAFGAAMGGAIFPGGGVFVGGGGVGGPEPAPNAAVNAIAEFLSLVDDKNQAFKLVAAEDQPREGNTNEYRLTFQPSSGTPKPAKLIYSGRRHTTIDVPFVLKDVPLLP